jgi:hypothetical protein
MRNRHMTHNLFGIAPPSCPSVKMENDKSPIRRHFRNTTLLNFFVPLWWNCEDATTRIARPSWPFVKMENDESPTRKDFRNAMLLKISFVPLC